MKRIFLLIPLLLIISAVYAFELGDRAPDFKAVTIDGYRTDYYRDLLDKKPVYLIFWATW